MVWHRAAFLEWHTFSNGPLWITPTVLTGHVDDQLSVQFFCCCHVHCKTSFSEMIISETTINFMGIFFGVFGTTYSNFVWSAMDSNIGVHGSVFGENLDFLDLEIDLYQIWRPTYYFMWSLYFEWKCYHSLWFFLELSKEFSFARVLNYRLKIFRFIWAKRNALGW